MNQSGDSSLGAFPWINFLEDGVDIILRKFQEERSDVASSAKESLPLPTHAEMRDMLSNAFWASLKQNELRPTRCSIAFTDRTERFLRFENDFPYDSVHISKLAQALTKDAWLSVLPRNGELRIIGIGYGFLLPSRCLEVPVVKIAGPGLIKVDVGFNRPFIIFNESSATVVKGFLD
jgi:hypothetical protein